MSGIASKPSLTQIGTRYDHYMELKEVFMEGVDVLNRMNPNFVGDEDKKLKVKLQDSVDMINRRIDVLSDFKQKTEYYGDLAKEVRSAGIYRAPQLGVINVEPEPKDINRTSIAENPST